jgi:hypothetical protein
MFLLGLVWACVVAIAMSSESEGARKASHKTTAAYGREIATFIDRGLLVQARESYTDMHRTYGNPMDHSLWSTTDKRKPRLVQVPRP